jgi:hypothetical protein
MTWLLAGCAPAHWMPLSPASGRQVLASQGGDVQVRAEPDSTRPLWMIPSSFTPVRISVHNTGSGPVYVALGDIQLLFDAGASAAVPPTSIVARQRVASLGMDPASPFIARQTLGSVGARAGRTESIVLEPSLGSQFQSTFGWQDRSQARILESAFAPGTIDAGQHREGFVYFRQVPKHADRLRLRIGVRPRPGSAPISVIEFAYAVQS